MINALKLKIPPVPSYLTETFSQKQKYQILINMVDFLTNNRGIKYLLNFRIFALKLKTL